MTTSLRNAWITPQSVQARRVHVMIKQDGRRGIVWDGVALDVQMARDKIAVVFGDDKPAQYYTRSEIEIIEEQS